MSTNFSFGSNSARACPIKDFPTPGGPINKRCLLCFATFFTILTALSWPIICSTIVLDTLISAVVLKLRGFIISC